MKTEINKILKLKRSISLFYINASEKDKKIFNKEFNQELKYLFKNENFDKSCYNFWIFHPNTFRLFEEYNLFNCIKFLDSLKNEIDIYKFEYKYPYQFNEFLFSKLSTLNKNNYPFELTQCLYFLNSERALEDLELILMGLK